MEFEIALPGTWKAFGPFNSEDPVPASETLRHIPQTLRVGNQTRSSVDALLEDDSIDLATAFGGRSSLPVYCASKSSQGRTAWLFVSITLPQAGSILVGAGADWWMQWFVDGECVCDTVTPDAHGNTGNGMGMYGIHNHQFTIDLTAGEHVLAVRVISGSQGWRLWCGTGDAVRRAAANSDQLEREVALASARREKNLLKRQAMPAEPFDQMLRGFCPATPSHADLAAGPLRVRLLPRMTKPSVTHYSIHAQADRVIAAVKKHRVGDSWVPSGDFEPYIKTGEPLLITYKHEETLKHQIDAEDPELSHLVCRLEQEYGNRLFSFQVGEWCNYFTWDLRVFHTTPAEIPHIDRRVMYQRVMDTFREWKATVRGHINSVNGFGLITHIGAEAGEDLVGIETGENIPCAQVARAFARGAARQFGVPWMEQISQWYQNTVPTGRPVPLTDMTPGSVHPTFVGEHTGHSVSLLSRMWLTAWFAGAAAVNTEAASGYLFDVAYTDREFPEDVQLSEYGRWAQKLFSLMKTQDIGVPYTPFAVLVSKFHGRMTFWREIWRHFPETTGDVMTTRFFDQLFHGQSMGPGFEQRYLCPSPYGDTFDVFVNDAERSALSAYPVILVVGDVEWTGQDIDFLQGYVQSGGILCLNEMNVNMWDRKFLGLAYDRFGPASDAETVLASADGSPRLIRRKVGGGVVFVSAAKPEPSMDAEFAFPAALLQALTRAFLPFVVDGEVQTLINRTAAGWAVMLVNNQGFIKTRLDPPMIDATETKSVRISWTGASYRVRSLLGPAVREERDSSIILDLPPGELAILLFEG